jgi:DNA polymerase
MHLIERKSAGFAALVAEAAACRLCAAMCGRTAVLSERNGNVNARVMFIGEAPGRQGGDRTRVPFSGDQSGHNFARYLASINLARSEIFITNSVLCNPRKASGANRKPTTIESANCADLLRRQIELIAPQVIVTLGAVALAALSRIEYHQFSLKDSAGCVCVWADACSCRFIIPARRCSPRTAAKMRSCATTAPSHRPFAAARFNPRRNPSRVEVALKSGRRQR